MEKQIEIKQRKDRIKRLIVQANDLKQYVKDLKQELKLLENKN